MALENLVKSNTLKKPGYFQRQLTYYALTVPFTAKQMWRKAKTAFNSLSIEDATKASLALSFIAPQAVIAAAPIGDTAPAAQVYQHEAAPKEEKNEPNAPNLDSKLEETKNAHEINSSEPNASGNPYDYNFTNLDSNPALALSEFIQTAPEPTQTAPNLNFNIGSTKTPPNLPVTKEVYRLMGSLSLVGGYATEDFPIEKYEGTPGILISSIGYNILDRDRKEGTLLFPNLRVIGQLNKSKYPWGNLLEVCPGFYAQKLPFGIGAEFVHREPLKPGAGDFVQRTSYLGQESEDFFRAYFHGWSDWHGKPMSDSLESPMQFWGTQYFEFRYDTSSFDNLVFDARADLNLSLLRIGPSPQREYKLPGILKFDGVTITPFAAVTFNYDYKNEPWNRFVQGSGGLKIIEGPYELFFEFGYRNSLNGPRYQGPVFNALVRVWLPLDFGKHEVRR